MLGHDVVQELLKRGYEVTGSGTKQDFSWKNGRPDCGYACLDITDREAVVRTLEREKPDAVIHCAAWNAVDLAEEEANRGNVMAVNALGTGYIAESCVKTDCKLIYISTDFVFDGSGEKPASADETSFGPLNYYGMSKLEGEKKISASMEKFYIVRTSWAYGVNGENFVKTMIKAGKKHDTVRVVNDQIATPTYTRDLARLLADMAESDKYGFYNATNEGGFVSKYELILEAYRQFGLDTKVIPVTTEEYGPILAMRPKNGRMCKEKIKKQGFLPLPDWRDALNRYLAEETFLSNEVKNGTDQCCEKCRRYRGSLCDHSRRSQRQQRELL